jgi:hypothetical protein
MDIEKMKKIGGKEWQTGNHHRIYFNNLIKWFGLECTLYGTGNISSASLNGENISNVRAREIAMCLNSGKVWYDVNEKEFYFNIRNCRTYAALLGQTIIDNIESKLENTI